MRLAIILPAILLASTLGLPGAYAAGGDSGGSGPTVTKCKKGEVWDKKKKKCAPPQRGELDDESIYEAGRDLAKAERYEEAIAVLELAANQYDPRILNYLGYSNRKMGRIEIGLKYYQAALAEKPDFTLVREYLGEAHLQMGNLKAAKEQLAEIERLCGGTTCEEYQELAEGIEKFEKG
jgi:tetratricopeptide (TPR) repeat protein